MHTFLLSLPDSRQRRLSALGQIQGSGLSFELVDGVEAGKMRIESLPIDPDALDWLKTGEIGCYFGHLRILQRIVDYGLRYACVLEDDFCFETDPDFGLAEIGPHLPKPFHYVHLQRDLGLNPNYGVVGTQDRFLRVCETPYCTTGYVIEHSLASYILEHHSVCRMPIDHLYAELSRRGLFYQSIKPLIGIQCGLPSDIQQTG